MSFVELLGYVAMILVSGSFLLKDVIKLRIVNTAGAICFIIYGLLIAAYPVAWLNVFVACVNTYYILSGLRQK